jgi:hypothetical protein
MPVILRGMSFRAGPGEGGENMGKFFEGYKDDRPDTDQGEFLSGKEKDVLIEEGTPFEVNGISGPVKTKFGERWVMQASIEGEPRALGFAAGKVPSRDRMMAALHQHLSAGGEPPIVKIVLKGKSQVLVDAEDES